MFFMPFQVLGTWLRGLLALVLIAGGAWLLTWWNRHREVMVTDEVPVASQRQADPGGTDGPPTAQQTHVVHWEFGLNRETAALVAGLLLLGWSLGGGWLVRPGKRKGASANKPQPTSPASTQCLRLSDGSSLRVRTYGPADGDPVVLTHGWGLDSDEWAYAQRELASTYRVITWDLPGLGQSERPADRDWSLDKLARDLQAVIALAGDRPVVLVGHSIGTMILLTYCKLFPEALGSRVRALVLAQGTYTNPVRTTAKAGLYTALQKPVLEPLCHLMVWLSPLVRALNALSYLNGSAHRSTERDSFSGHETQGQLDFITRYYCKAAPDVLGRGMLAMFRFDATDVLPRIAIPTLVVAGDDDRTCLPQASHYMAESIPGARLVLLAQSRHCGLFEHHDTFHRAIHDLLASLGRQQSRADKPTAAGPNQAVTDHARAG